MKWLILLAAGLILVGCKSTGTGTPPPGYTLVNGVPVMYDPVLADQADQAAKANLVVTGSSSVTKKTDPDGRISYETQDVQYRYGHPKTSKPPAKK